MSLEEEVRAFADKYIPNGQDYLTEVAVPAFGGHTWQDVFDGTAVATPALQRAVLKRLRDVFGNRTPLKEF
jgi:hypothetical protein